MSLRAFGVGSSLVIASLAIACGSTAERRGGFVSEKNPTLGKDAGPPKGGFGGTDGEDGEKGIPASECGVNNTGSGDPEKDYDGDGYALKDDCNECNKSVNKGAQDIGGNGVDEDCSGAPDDEPESCDDALALAPGDGYEAAAALGLCKKADASGRGWGLLEAKLVKSDGKTLSDERGVGVVPAYGVNKPKEGKRLFVISSGAARSPKDEGHTTGDAAGLHTGYSTGVPDGYPKKSTTCEHYEVASSDAKDGAGLQVKIRVPSNAKSFTYEHFFLTQEFPDWVCSKFNDFFVTMMTPIPAGLPDGNIAFDSQNNPISVNNGLFRACKAGTYTIGGSGGGLGGILGGGAGGGEQRDFDCPDGTANLKNTGFEKNGGTGWLTTQAPVTPGQEITLLFTVWDSGDAALDSTVLLDNFKFSLESSGTTQTAPTDVK